MSTAIWQTHFQIQYVIHLDHGYGRKRARARNSPTPICSQSRWYWVTTVVFSPAKFKMNNIAEHCRRFLILIQHYLHLSSHLTIQPLKTSSTVWTVGPLSISPHITPEVRGLFASSSGSLHRSGRNPAGGCSPGEVHIEFFLDY